MTQYKRTLVVLAVGQSLAVAGDFNWLRMLPVSLAAGQSAVEIGLRESPGSPFTNFGVMEYGDVLNVPYSEAQFRVPSTALAAVRFWLIQGSGAYIPDGRGLNAGTNVVTPLGFDDVGFFANRATIGSYEVISEASNVRGIILRNIIMTAQGDGTHDGGAMITRTITTPGPIETTIALAILACDKDSGPVAITLPDMEVPANYKVQLVCTSSKDRIGCGTKVL